MIKKVFSNLWVFLLIFIIYTTRSVFLFLIVISIFDISKFGFFEILSIFLLSSFLLTIQSYFNNIYKEILFD